MQNGQKKGTQNVGRLLSAATFAERLGIKVERLFDLLERYPKTFERVPRIMGLPRFEFHIWEKVVRNLLTRPLPSAKPSDLPAVDERNEEEKGNGSASDIITYGESRATRELYSARTAKLDYLRRSGKLVEISAVIRAWRDIAINVQKSILSVPDRIAPLCIGEPDLVIIRNRMRSELLYALKNLSFTISGATAEKPERHPSDKGTIAPSDPNPRKAGAKKKVDK